MLSVFAQTGVESVGAFATFINTIFKGLAMGGVYAIIALGFVIIFKATQVVNFAQGALAAAGGLFLSFLVFDQVSSDAPRGQTPFTWWRAPFAGEGFPDTSEQWASILLIAVVGGLVTALLAGKDVSGWALGSGFAAFLACRWLATRSGFTWLESPFLSLVIAIIVGVAVAGTAVRVVIRVEELDAESVGGQDRAELGVGEIVEKLGARDRRRRGCAGGLVDDRAGLDLRWRRRRLRLVRRGECVIGRSVPRGTSWGEQGDCQQEWNEPLHVIRSDRNCALGGRSRAQWLGLGTRGDRLVGRSSPGVAAGRRSWLRLGGRTR